MTLAFMQICLEGQGQNGTMGHIFGVGILFQNSFSYLQSISSDTDLLMIKDFILSLGYFILA